MRWQILAGIGKVESDQANGRHIDHQGNVTPAILGPRLDGRHDTRVIRDTDHGRYDHDTVYDRAVGPMQFLPGTWTSPGRGSRRGPDRGIGRDGNGDGLRDPSNAYDATAAAVVHLCGSESHNFARNADRADLAHALLIYNHSQTYVNHVLAWIDTYDQYTAQAPRPDTGKGARMLAAAAKWIGWPYSYAGGDENGPTYGTCCTPAGKDGSHIKGFDCSGLTIYALAQVGVHEVAHSATWQWDNARKLGGRQVPRNNGLNSLHPGDLVFFSTNPGNPSFMHHVGIYAGRRDGQHAMLNAPRPGRTVEYDPIADDYAGAVAFPVRTNATNLATELHGVAATDPTMVPTTGQLSGRTLTSYFWDDGSGRNGDTGTPASGMPMKAGLAASPSWPMYTRGYVIYRDKAARFVIGDRGPGAPSREGVMLDLDAKTFAYLTDGRFDPATLTVGGASGLGRIRIRYVITSWGPGPGRHGPPAPLATGAWSESA